MKHPPILRLLLALLLALTATTATAYDFEVDGIYYNKNSDGTSVSVTYKDSNYKSYSGSVTIPSQVTYSGTTYSVTSIGLRAFYDCSSLTSVTIPNSVTSIGYEAFYSCSGLTSVTIPNSVTKIGSSAFSDCSGLTSVTIPNSVTSIGSSAFSYCSGLTSVTIPNSVTEIGYDAFRNCSGLTSVTIPNSVTSIGEEAFYGTPFYDNLPDGVVYIGRVLYKYKGDMPMNTSISIQEGTVSISPDAFRGCTGLTSVTIGNSVTNIYGAAFYGCSGLTSVTITNSVTEIGAYAFYDTPFYNNLPDGVVYLGRVLYKYKGDMPQNTSISIQEGTVSITPHAFSGCTGLTSVTIPNSVTEIGYEAFWLCSGLTSVTIPNSVTKIGSSAFSDCSGLTSVTIPNSVTSIGDYAFSYCSGLTSVTIPNSVTEICKSTFEGCSGLTSVTIGDSVTEIGSSAFEGCSSLTSVIIPKSVTSIGDGAFDCGDGLTKVIYNAMECEVYGYPFGSYNSKITSFVIGPDVKIIPDYLCRHLDNLSTITIPNSVSSIGKGAFMGCTELTTVNIPNSVMTIGVGAFKECYNLTSVTLPNILTEIPNNLFWSCNNLISVTIPEFVTSIGDWAFYYCSGLTSVTIPNSVTSIGNSAFYYCSGLTSVTIPNSVTWIGNFAFSHCSSLTSVTIGNSVTSIGGDAFKGCTRLSTIEYDSNNYLNFSYLRDGLENKIRFVYGNSVTTANTQFLHDLQPVSVTIGTNVSSIVGNSYTPTKTIWLTNTTPEGCEKVKGSVNFVSNDKYPQEWTTEVYSYLSSWFEVDGVVYVPVVPSERTCDAFDVCYGALPSELTLGEVTFNDITLNVKNISQYTFSGCDQITSITLNEGISSLGNYALNYCNSIKELTIPSTMQSIGDCAFRGCTSLNKVTISNRNTELLLGSNGSSPLFVDCPLSEIYIGGNIAYSSDEAHGYSPFYRNATLKTVVITDEETEISDNEFYGCTNLTNITMGDGVERIGNWAFSGCSSLNQLQFGSGMKTIGDEAFSDCANVTAIYSYTAVPPVCGIQALDDINKWTCKLYVPDGHIPAYQAADQWKDFFFVTGNEDVSIDGGVEVSVEGGVLHCGGVDTEVYTLSGAMVYSGCGDVELAAGAYIVVAEGRATKVVVN